MQENKTITAFYGSKQ